VSAPGTRGVIASLQVFVLPDFAWQVFVYCDNAPNSRRVVGRQNAAIVWLLFVVCCRRADYTATIAVRNANSGRAALAAIVRHGAAV
jgi:hypothetical protein